MVRKKRYKFRDVVMRRGLGGEDIVSPRLYWTVDGGYSKEKNTGIGICISHDNGYLARIIHNNNGNSSIKIELNSVSMKKKCNLGCFHEVMSSGRVLGS